ncbi:glycine cleavage system H-protein subunit [Agyrium rufum]|nr:glycine cleavage system H-protein subunit [Agyrium rufum]
MGISKHAAQALGDIVFVELPDISLELAPNDVIGAVESVKSASDLYSPVAGTVTEVNSSLEETPSIMNKDAEGEGWIAKLKIKEGEMEKGKEKLMKKEAYDTFIQE